MKDTTFTAKNTWRDGLIMDFAPENTQATCLTNALNATFLTYNGNEMTLQNDMGNGRVETAFLPEGYMPVGTCEFGGIIYIVSYNPLLNKSLIGCFPSPERNITSKEIGDLNLKLSTEDFLELVKVVNETTNESTIEPTGKLKTTTVKKILFGEKYMTSGDKYIIYTSEDLPKETLSDYGNTNHVHDDFPKLVKIHVVSIEDSGKIVYLDSTTKWYDNDYYITKHDDNDIELDLDSYRTLAKSNYSVFSSKVSGKLALLVELEKITGFSCGWVPYSEPWGDNGYTSEPGKPPIWEPMRAKSENPEIEYQDYHIFLTLNWTNDNPNINPNGVVLLESNWVGEFGGRHAIFDKVENKVNLSEPLPLPKKYIYGLDAYNEFYEDGCGVIHLTNCYDPSCNMDYKHFKEKGSYEAQETKTIGELQLKVKSTPNKVSIEHFINRKDDMSFDANSYYVNAIKALDGKYYTAYTDENGNAVESTPQKINDDIINNYFHYPVFKKLGTFKIPKYQIIDGVLTPIDLSNFIYHYKIAPTMPYGVLEEYALEGYIDFNKLGKKSILLNTWKYYNLDNLSHLVWGMEAYTEPNKVISDVTFEFYDNQGFVGAYHNSGKSSYNGTFSEYIPLNGEGSNYKFNNIKADGTVSEHIGLNDVTIDLLQDSSLYTFTVTKTISKKYFDDGSLESTENIEEYLISCLLDNTYKVDEAYIDKFSVGIMKEDVVTITDDILKLVKLDKKQYYTKAEVESIYKNLPPNITYNLTDCGWTKLSKEEVKEENMNENTYVINDEVYNLSISGLDSGTIYSNGVYLVKIVIEYSNLGVLGEVKKAEGDDIIEDYRWFWTNNMFNDYFYNTQDFKDLLFVLDLDINAQYTQSLRTDLLRTVLYTGEDNSDKVGKEYQNLQANVTFINSDENNGNINCSVLAGFRDNYNTFNIFADLLDKFNVNIYMGNLATELSKLPNFISTKDNLTMAFEGIYPTNAKNYEEELNKISPTLKELLGISSTKAYIIPEINSDETSYKNYNNVFDLVTIGEELEETSEEIEYYSEITKNLVKLTTKPYTKSLEDIEVYNSKAIALDLRGIHYSKFYLTNKLESGPKNLIQPLIYNIDDLDKYNLSIKTVEEPNTVNEPHFMFNAVTRLSGGLHNDDNEHRVFWGKNFDLDANYRIEKGPDGTHQQDLGGYNSFLQQNYLENIKLQELYNKLTPAIICNTKTGSTRCWFGYGTNYNNSIVGGIRYATPMNTYSSLLPINDKGGDEPLDSKNTGRTLDAYDNDLIFLNFRDLITGKTEYTTKSFFLLLLKDSNDIVHIVNTMLPLIWLNDQPENGGKAKSTITLWLKDLTFKDSNNNERSCSVGDLIASTLCNLYYFTGATTNVEYAKLDNFVYLEDYSTYFTKDIIFKLNVQENISNNSLILMSGIDYAKYLDSICEQVTLDTAKQTELKSLSNVNLKINSVLKNCPIKIEFKYITPEYKDVTSSNYVIHKVTGEPIFSDYPVNNNLLYYIKDGKLSIVDSEFSFNLLSNPKVEGNLVKASVSPGILIGHAGGSYEDSRKELLKLKNKNFWEGFILKDGELRCKNTNYNTTISKSASLFLDRYGEGCTQLQPIFLNETLAPWYIKLLGDNNSDSCA